MDENLLFAEGCKEALTVTQLNTLVRDLMEGSDLLSRIAVRGEISNFVSHRSGHLYFSLKDEGSLVRAVMFRSAASRLRFAPENGMKVLVFCSVTTYIKDGQYQLYVTAMEPDGVGALYLAIEQLKKKLAAEGLFEQARKKPLPKIPSRIGIITSPTGAAVRDMLHILKRRFPYAAVYLYPALVQGAEAPGTLIEGLTYFNREKKADLIIIGRGGGSAEDLFAFQNEALARAVAASAIPVISAVGHETDFTICDFVADLRAPTPSAAAELAVPEADKLMQKFRNVIDRMALLCRAQIEKKKAATARLSASRALSDPMTSLRQKELRLMHATEALGRSAGHRMAQYRASLAEVSARLEGLSPLAVLHRGYALCTVGGHPLCTVTGAKTGDSIRVHMCDGRIAATVTDIRITKDEEKVNAGRKTNL